MSDKCKNPSCENELVHIQGRRKKEFCSKECRNKVNTALFHERHKGDKKTKMKCIPIDEYNRLVEASKGITGLIGIEPTVFEYDYKKGASELNSTLKSTNSKKENESKGSFEKGIIVPVTKNFGIGIPSKVLKNGEPAVEITQHPDPNYPIRKQGESGIDYQIRVKEYQEKK